MKDRTAFWDASALVPLCCMENPRLPVFVSIQIDELYADQTAQQDAIFRILPYTDLIAVSSYPYLYGYDDPAKTRATLSTG